MAEKTDPPTPPPLPHRAASVGSFSALPAVVRPFELAPFPIMPNVLE